MDPEGPIEREVDSEYSSSSSEDEEDIAADLQDYIMVSGSIGDKRKVHPSSPLSPGSAGSEVKSPRRDSESHEGKYVLRAARQEDPLHFIHRMRLQSEDKEMSDLVTVIRSTDTSEQHDIDTRARDKFRSIITAVMVQQFETKDEAGEDGVSLGKPISAVPHPRAGNGKGDHNDNMHGIREETAPETRNWSGFKEQTVTDQVFDEIDGPSDQVDGDTDRCHGDTDVTSAAMTLPGITSAGDVGTGTRNQRAALEDELEDLQISSGDDDLDLCDDPDRAMMPDATRSVPDPIPVTAILDVDPDPPCTDLDEESGLDENDGLEPPDDGGILDHPRDTYYTSSREHDQEREFEKKQQEQGASDTAPPISTRKSTSDENSLRETEVAMTTGDDVTDSTEPLSLKEELNDREEEKEDVYSDESGSDDLSSDSEGHEQGDDLADLDRVFQDPKKAKERESTGSIEQLDFNALQSNRPLNLDASKQRVQLRQKGSLAKRRRPTRTSVRTNADDNLLDDEPGTNGAADRGAPSTRRSLSEEEKTDSSKEDEDEDEEERRRSERAGLADMEGTNLEEAIAKVSDGPVLRTGRTIAGIRTAITLPGIGEAGRQRLKTVPQDTAQRKAAAGAAPAAGGAGGPAATPPWLMEARLRRSARQPRGEAEKLQQERQPETPAWMKDAVAKRQRASNLVQKKESARSISSGGSPSDDGVTAPWQLETSRRRSGRPTPLSQTNKDLSAHSPGMPSPPAAGRSPSSAPPLDTVAPAWTPAALTHATPPYRAFSQPAPSPSREQDENTPPVAPHGGERQERELFVTTDDLMAASKMQSPMSSVPVSPIPSLGELDEPMWKAEVALRRKSKSYIVAHKPEQPLRLGETPQWKRELLEKKQKRSSTADTPPHTPRSGEVPDASPTSSLPPWKQELNQRKKRISGILTLVSSPSEKENTEDIPEWTKLAQKRRARLANTGLITDERDQNGAS